jgi:hypothetical protein
MWRRNFPSILKILNVYAGDVICIVPHRRWHVVTAQIGLRILQNYLVMTGWNGKFNRRSQVAFLMLVDLLMLFRMCGSSSFSTEILVSIFFNS